MPSRDSSADGRKITSGIKRLKLHYDNTICQVADCQNVPLQVRKYMFSVLKEDQLTKKEKDKRGRDLEE